MGNFKVPIVAVGKNTAFVQISPDPIIAQRDPAPNDEAFDGQVWVNTLTNTAYISAGTDSLGTVWVVSGSSTFTGFDLTINPGPTVLNGDFTVSANTGDANAVDISTNGAVTERILITNVQGTSTDAIAIDALVGGLDLISGSVGADSVLVSASDPAGGVTINAGTGGITLSTAGAITLSPGTATVFDVAVGDLTLEAATGSVIVEAGEAVSDAVQITAFDAAGGVSITAGTGGITSDTTGAVSLGAAAASDFTVTGAFDLTLTSSLGSVDIIAGSAVSDSIILQATDLAGGVTIDSGTAGITMDTTGALSIGAEDNSDITVTGAFNLLLESTLGKVIIDSGKAAADAVDITCAAGGIDIDGALQINLESTQAAATAISINASNAAGGVVVNAGTGGIALNTTGAIAFNPGTATIFDVATGNLTLEATTGSVIVEGGAASATAVHLDATLNAAGGVTIDAGTGGIDLDTTGALSLDGAAASNVTVTGAFDLTVNSTAGSVIVQGGEAVADAIQLTTGGTGGITGSFGTAGMTMSTTGAATLAASGGDFDINATGGTHSINLSSAGGVINLGAGQAIADAVVLSAAAGGLDADFALQVNIDSSQAAIDAIRLFSSNAAGGMDIDAGTGGITVDTTGLLSLDSAGATNLTATGAFDVLVRSTGAAVQLLGGKAALDAIGIGTTNAAGGLQAILGTGGFNATTTGALILDGAANSHVTTTGAFSMLVSSTAGNTSVVSGKAADAGAVTISASAGNGGITLDAGPTPGVTLTNGTQSAQVLTGTGSPNTVVTALQGSLFLRTDGGVGSTVYYNTNGITAWTAVA
jgi:hypothetical protein